MRTSRLRFLVLCDACFLLSLRLCGCFFAACLELLDAASGVDQLLLTGEERMAVRADFNLELRLGGADFEHCAAGAGHLCFREIGRMDILFHMQPSIHHFFFLTSIPEVQYDRGSSPTERGENDSSNDLFGLSYCVVPFCPDRRHSSSYSPDRRRPASMACPIFSGSYVWLAPRYFCWSLPHRPFVRKDRKNKVRAKTPALAAGFLFDLPLRRSYTLKRSSF